MIQLITESLPPNELIYKVNEVVTNTNNFELRVNECELKVTNLTVQVALLNTRLDSDELRLTDIEAIIPEEASTTNILVDRAYLNNTIATSTGVFCGNWPTVNDIPLHAEEFEPLGAQTPTVNAYLIVENGPDNKRWRYKYPITITTEQPYDRNNWKKEYAIDATFTTEQQAAIDSGVTSSKVGNYDAHLVNTGIHVQDTDKTAWNNHIADTTKHITEAERTAWNAKQNAIVAGANIGISGSTINCLYTLPQAASSTLGGVRTGSNITNTNGTISITKTNVVNALGYTPLQTLKPLKYIGEIFSVIGAGDSWSQPGCAPCLGGEYSGTAYTDIYTKYLVAGKLVTCSYDDYNSYIGTYGQCALWAIDTVNKKFKVPTIKTGSFLEQAAVGAVHNPGLPNITGQHAAGNGMYTYYYASGAFYHTPGGDYGNPSPGWGGSTYLWDDMSFDASRCSGIYGASTTVQPQSVGVKFFVYIGE